MGRKKMKTPLSEKPFGKEKMDTLDIGDMVKWRILSTDLDKECFKMGIITNLFLETMGNREVAMAEVLATLTNDEEHVINNSMEKILVINLDLVSKAGGNNGKYII
jgi:hypothetical protein